MSKAPAGADGAIRRVPPGRQFALWLSGLIGSRYDGLHNFAVVEPGVLMRCGQPRLKDLRSILRRHGLRTVIAARGGTRHPLRGLWFSRERRFCHRHGIAFEHLPFSDQSQPPGEIFDRFIQVVSQPAARPVLVHCEQGFHRTGVLVAAYRVRLGGWTLGQALEEMRRAGFDPDDPRRRALYEAFLEWATGC